MATVSTFNPLWDGLTWAIVHSTWQGALAVFLYLMGRMLLADASRRHTLGLICFLFFLAMQIATVACYRQWQSGKGFHLPFALTAGNHIETFAEAELDNNGLRRPAVLPTESILIKGAGRIWPAVVWLGWFWAIGVVVYAIRYFAASYLLRRELLSCGPLEPQVARNFVLLAQRLKITRPIRFVRTSESSVPATCGWLRPVVLLPTEVKLKLPGRLLDAMVLHELAHILRRDSLTHHLRRVLSLFYFFHPLVRWLDRQMIGESEKAADEIAARAFGDHKLYAAALLQLEQTRTNALVIGSTGGSLKDRLLHVLAARHTKYDHTSKLSLLLMILCGLLILMTCGELWARGLSADQRLLVSLSDQDLSETALDTFQIDTATDHASPAIANAVQEHEANGTLSEATLIELADALWAGTAPDLLSRRWYGRVNEIRQRSGRLDELGTTRTRAAIAWQLTDLARRTADPNLQGRYARAAYVLLALDLAANNAADARQWFLAPENLPLLHLDAETERRLDFAVALHIRRSGEATPLLAGLADLDEATALRAVEASAYEICTQIRFSKAASARDWAQLGALLRMAKPDVRQRWQRMFSRELAQSH